MMPARPQDRLASRTKGNHPLSELKRTELSVRQEKAVLVGVILPGSTADPRDPLGELASLVRTAGAKVVGTVLQKRLTRARLLEFVRPRHHLRPRRVHGPMIS